MKITDSTFDQVIAENSLVLVDFWADWCGPCLKLSPILDEVSSETGLLIAKLHVEENPGKTQEYDVSTIPTMVLFKDGNPVNRITGAIPKHKLLKELSEWI
jgi:thioredoxin 1